MHSTGEKPGIGTYQCVNCGTEIHLDDNTKNGIVGAEAKEIANNIIDRYYRSDM